jgi:hypothetical protein
MPSAIIFAEIMLGFAEKGDQLNGSLATPTGSTNG